ncbi:hypothetical protein Pdsh_02255 [Pyrodictium delaneyi]|uniref:Uncharacterized protein n=1 Tax=Pyrodictium delaneyi TaxID=1273541 RepID=A0A211YRN3_9CREN|nr:hypothetical protein Pdsh_02255 [Pyrodictium delaneyi]
MTAVHESLIDYVFTKMNKAMELLDEAMQALWCRGKSVDECLKGIDKAYSLIEDAKLELSEAISEILVVMVG